MGIDSLKTRLRNRGLASMGLGVVLVLLCQQAIAGHALPHGWRAVAFLAGIAAAAVCLGVGTWNLVLSQR